MDFFEYASVVLSLGGELWVSLMVGAICFAIIFIFEGVALFVIAKREGYKNKWMAFIPFFNTYYIGVCAQKNKIYNMDAKKIGLLVAIFELVLVAGYVLYYVAYALLSLNNLIKPVTLTNNWGMTYETYSLVDNVPSNLSWAAWVYNYMYLILNVADLVYLIFEIFLLFAFFQTYACRRYVLFTFTSILFPIQGILFFVVRNNRGVNYREFIRNEQAKQYRMYHQYQQQQNFYQNPYNQNPYNRNNNDYGAPPSGEYNGSSARQAPPDDPFGGLGGTGTSGNSGGSPFDDYN